ncbi:putative protein YqjD [Methylophilaceae bacterium]|nr:putative protein YqjD [Methylophilaceae bacterium]
MKTPETTNNEKLVQDIKAVVSDAEAILHATAGQAGGEIAQLRSTMTARLAEAKNRLMEAETAMVDKAKIAAKATDEYVHENPWQSIVIAGGVGFLVGYLVSSRRD